MVPYVGKMRNRGVEVNSDPEFWEFHEKRVDGGPYAPHRNIRKGWGKHGKSGRCRTTKEAVEDRETNDLSAMVK